MISPPMSAITYGLFSIAVRCCSLDEMPTRVNPEELTLLEMLEIGLCDGLLNGNPPLGHPHFS